MYRVVIDWKRDAMLHQRGRDHKEATFAPEKFDGERQREMERNGERRSE